MSVECDECLTERAYNQGQELAGGHRHGTCISILVLALSMGWRQALWLAADNPSVP